MPEGNFGPIKFGPGGQVLVENKELIVQIENAPALTPSTLLKLADFYQEYPSNRPLGDHLSLVALSVLVSVPSVKAALDKAASANIDWSDILEDIWDFTSNDEPPKEDPGDGVQSVKLVSDGDVNLLTETVKVQGQKSFFVIGVAPALDSLGA